MKSFIGDMKIGMPGRCVIIAEAGSNHNGKVEVGKKLIEMAKQCGCDVVKFQAFKTEYLVTEKADKADYQVGKSTGKNQFEMLKDLELSLSQHNALVKHAKNVGIPLFYSVFDQYSADLVEQLGVTIFKLGSGELTNLPLIKHIAKKNKPLILSTGMATDEEIAEAVNVCRKNGNEEIILMNCSTGYPSRLEDTNLRRIDYLHKKFGVLCGNSDHTAGIVAAVMSAALGTPLLEKHFTLDKNMEGPDHPMSMDPHEMKDLSRAVRQVEKTPVNEDGLHRKLVSLGFEITKDEIELLLGRGVRDLSEVEKSQRRWARKSVVAAKTIPRGEKLSNDNVAVKRPESGIPPKDFEKVFGRTLKQLAEAGKPITWDMLE